MLALVNCSKNSSKNLQQYICDFTFSTNPDFIRSLYVHDRKLRVSGRLRKIEGVFNSKISRGAPDRNERAALR